MVIKQEESSMKDSIIHRFTTTIVAKSPGGLLNSYLLSTTDMCSTTPPALSNMYSIQPRTKPMKEPAALSLQSRWPSGAGGGYMPCARSAEKSMFSKHRSPELQSGAHHKAIPPHSEVWASTAKCCGWILCASCWNSMLCTHRLVIQQEEGKHPLNGEQKGSVLKLYSELLSAF